MTLLNPDKKSAYDEELRQELGDAEDLLGPSIDQLGGGMTLPSPGGMVPDAATDFSAPVFSAKPTRRKKPAWMLPAGISVGALVILGLVVVIVLGNAKKDDDEKTVAGQNPVPQRDQSDKEDDNGETKNETTTNTNVPNVPVDPDKESTSRDEENGAKDATETNGATVTPTEDVDDTAEETPQVETPETNETAANPFEPKPGETETAEKQPLPTSQQQMPVEETLVETFDLSKERTAEQQLELARELFGLARESKDTVERFVLLRGAMRLAGEGGDAELVLKAVDEIDRHYKIDRLEIGEKALVGFGEQAATEAAMASLARAASRFIDEAIAADDIGVTATLAEAAYEFTLKKPVSTEVRKQAYDQRNQLNKVYDQWKKVQDALAKMEADPADPDANLVIGKWHCFEQQDWKTGLPYLAKSGHRLLSTLAAREMASSPESTGEMIAFADAWWDAAKADDQYKENMHRRAGFWYETAWSKGVKGIQ